VIAELVVLGDIWSKYKINLMKIEIRSRIIAYTSANCVNAILLTT